MDSHQSQSRRWTISLCAALLTFGGAARAQMEMPDSSPAPDGATLFRNQCAACHADTKGAPPRMGPNLFGVVGRKAASQPGYHYSSALAKADFTWDQAHLDKWLTDSKTFIPGTLMMYRQAKPAVRQTIIQYLTDQK